MLTPIEIERKVFKSGIGYEKKDVDLFLKDILDNYEAIYKENVELNDKINVLSEGIQYYKSIEKTLQKALVLAQRTSDETQEAAKKEAKAIEQEAHARADLILADARRELNSLHSKTINLVQQYDLYKAQFKQLAAAQLEILSSESFQIHVANLDAFLAQTEEYGEENYSEEAAMEEGYYSEEGEEEECSVLLPEKLEAPVEAGRQVGAVNYCLDGELLREYPIRTKGAMDEMDFAWILRFIWQQYSF